MHLRLPVVLLSAFALVAPVATAGAQGKSKSKGNKDKDKQGQSDDRRGGRGDDNDRNHDGNHDGDHDADGKITICHVPPGNGSARNTISIGEAAWSAHEKHGDYRGACHGTNHGGPNNRGRFNELDTNNDGVLAFNEWRGDRASFNRLDRNNNGSLSRDEYSRY